MLYTPIVPPRKFEAGFEHKRIISDCARIHLEAEEQVTFVTDDNAEYDVVRKNWGFYATPSTNGRLASFGLRTCIIRNRDNRLFIVLVSKGKEDEFHTYLEQEKSGIVLWLDTSESAQKLIDWCNDASGS